MQKAQDSGIVNFTFHSPRDYAMDKHHSVDDRPYGGGPGMVMLPAPLSETLDSLGFAERKKQGRLIYLSPRGKPLTQNLAKELVQEEILTLVCGRYEGIDERIEELYPIECVSVGEAVLNGGEAAALCLIESVARLLPGFMGHENSGDDESFSHGLLEYPQYTRPEVFKEKAVPKILSSGNHEAIATWRRNAMLKVTLKQRPDLLDHAPLSSTDRHMLAEEHVERRGRNLSIALVHYPVLDKEKNSVAVSLTNLDIHDIARSSCSYGLGSYFIVTPVNDQQLLLDSILSHWVTGSGAKSNPDRKRALSLVKGVTSLEETIQEVEKRTGQAPFVVGTTASIGSKKVKKDALPELTFSGLRDVLESKPALLLLGTGQGLAPEAMNLCNALLPPVRWHGDYNHLSVRSAAAIILDRILGDWY